MDKIDVAELKGQLQWVEEELKTEPTNTELISFKQQLEELLQLGDQLQHLSGANTDMFGDQEIIPNTVSGPHLHGGAHTKKRKRLPDSELVNEAKEFNWEKGEIIDQEILDSIYSLSNIVPKPKSDSNETAELSNVVQLAEWEKYTRGIGSKLLAKYGYIKGQGIGKVKGISQPLPLDVQAGNSFAGLGHDHRLFKSRKLKKRVQQKPKVQKPKALPKSNFFDTLNTAVNIKHTVEDSGKDIKRLSNSELEEMHKRTKENVQRLQTHIVKLEQSFQRNKTRDPVTAAQVSHKLTLERDQLTAAIEQEKQLSTRLSFKTKKSNTKDTHYF